MDRLLRKRYIKNIDDVFNGEKDINNLIITLKAIKDTYDNEYKSVSIEIDYYGYDGGNGINLVGYTLENDEEFNGRISAEKKKQEVEEKKRLSKEDRERKELERLKAKYKE